MHDEYTRQPLLHDQYSGVFLIHELERNVLIKLHVL